MYKKNPCKVSSKLKEIKNNWKPVLNIEFKIKIFFILSWKIEKQTEKKILKRKLKEISVEKKFKNMSKLV